jgi:Domain of unknown function (DUF6980)
MANEHCYPDMSRALTFTCSKCRNRYECPDVLIDYSPKFDEYGLIVHDGGSSSISINFCPWCRARLGPSERDEWFNRLASLGFDDPLAQEIPEDFRSDAWYRNLTGSDEGRGS